MQSLSDALVATSSTFSRRLVSTGVLFAASDVLAQWIVQPAPPPVRRRWCGWGGWGGYQGFAWDAPRTLRVTFFGTVLFCPIIDLWLGMVLEEVPLSSEPAATLSKVVLDQFVMSPLLIVAFMYYMAFLDPLEERSGGLLAQSSRPWSSAWAWAWWPAGGEVQARLLAARRKLRTDAWVVLKQSWIVWIPVQIVTMGFVAPQNRLAFTNVVSLFWNAFLSYASTRAPNSRPADQLPSEEDESLLMTQVRVE